MKYPRKFGYVWKKTRVPEVSEKKFYDLELFVKKSPKNHLDRLKIYQTSIRALILELDTNKYSSTRQQLNQCTRVASNI